MRCGWKLHPGRIPVSHTNTIDEEPLYVFV